ncbi:MAG TPA: hypothetical protein VNC16_10850 [Solirubrobacterales bacterium]|nr:hypothetical protein [Solirubrobacterales bacterium]
MAASLTRKQLLIGLGIAMAGFYVAFGIIDASLKDTGGPSILGLEFAGSADRLEDIFAEWGAHGRDLARLSLWIDFPFMVVYGVFFALASLATRDFARAHDRQALAAAGGAAAAFAIAAALFDAAENILWLLLLGGHGGDAAPTIATGCAVVKFILIGLAIAYVLWGLAARLALHGQRADNY